MMEKISRSFLLMMLVAVLGLTGCDRNAATGSKLTRLNFDKITTGMSKAQVETIMGAPTSAETKDMLIFKKTVYRYEEGTNFAEVTFKNDELDSKNTNLGTQ